MVNSHAKKSGKVDYLGSYQRKIITVTKMEMNFKYLDVFEILLYYSRGFKILILYTIVV